MLVSPKWQTMWMESQHCSKSIMNVPIPAQRAKKALEDLKTNCCSPNKLIQLEALQCWGMWIKNQNADDWKLNTVCFTAVRPLITKKMQPLHKDVDIYKLKLSLLWALLVKVENIMQLEGPQYILEVFLQSCLSWLSSTGGEGCEDEISLLIFKLLLSIFNKNESLDDCDKEMFPPLSTDILNLKKVFHRLTDKFLNIFVYWRKVPDKSVFLQLWKHFLEYCELSCEHIPIPLWHKVFKLTDQICSEKNEPIKQRLAFLHSCATTLKLALSSSKFIDFGNLLTTPCEALLKKLVELCTVDCIEFCDYEMFLHSKEICQMLADKSVSLGGFDLCIGVLDVLEEFYLKDLLWGVWCGLVYCYKVHLHDLDKNHFSKMQMKFYRKLRGFAVNFELDRAVLHKDCIKEVEKHIDILNISCFCSLVLNDSNGKGEETVQVEPMEVDSKIPESLCTVTGVSDRITDMTPTLFRGTYSALVLYNKTKVPRKSQNFNKDLFKNILKNVDENFTKSLFNCLFGLRLIKAIHPFSEEPLWLSLQFEVARDGKEKLNLALPCLEARTPSHVPEYNPVERNALVLYEKHQKHIEKEEEVEEEEEEEEVIISTPKTRSKKRAEEEKKKEMESQRRKKRKSFEVLVQEIVRKNKERKTEKNSKRRSPLVLKSKKNRKKLEKPGNDNEVNKVSDKKTEVSERKLRLSKKEEPKNEKKKNKKSLKIDGKLENYFKIIRKKSGDEMNKEKKKPQKGKKDRKRESSCCKAEKEEGDKKGEIGWRQTSLKTMMNRKHKVDKNKMDMRSRNKNTDVTDEKPTPKKGNKVMDSPLSKLSPFKEVFHDHEYAKMEPQELQTFQRVLRARQEKVLEVQETKAVEKSNVETGKRPEGQKMKRKLVKIEKSKPGLSTTEKTDLETNTEINFQKIGELEQEKDQKVEVVRVVKSELLHCTENSPECEYSDEESEKMKISKEPQEEKCDAHTEIMDAELGVNSHQGKDLNLLVNDHDETKSEEPIAEVPVEKKLEIHPAEDFIIPEESTEMSELELLLREPQRGKKRIRMLDSLKPSKKMKLEDPQEEKLPLEITEKENLEEQQPKLISPSKKEKTGSGCLVGKIEGSPKSANGMISSRALRMIALVPESTKGSQIQWESRESRVEVLKCKKAPNVDKNSRASKMLALLSENVMELEEIDGLKTEEINSRKELSTTPNVKTPISSLKSPKSVKKRRSIRFDDAKNETVLYQTDTPPSQILEEKEKCRRIKPLEY